MSCHLRVQSQCPGLDPCESHKPLLCMWNQMFFWEPKKKRESCQSFPFPHAISDRKVYRSDMSTDMVKTYQESFLSASSAIPWIQADAETAEPFVHIYTLWGKSSNKKRLIPPWFTEIVQSVCFTHGPLCFPAGLLWIPCRPSLVDPSLHRASPALTLQTAKRIMWLWWVLIDGGETAHWILCFNDRRHLNTPCVSETTRSSLAEPSVYLPSHKWHQQPSPQEMWQCGLSITGLPAWITKPT